MNLVVHTVSGAPRGWRVLAGLTFKALPFRVRYLQASQREHKSPAYLSINPRGTVPSLQADDLIIPDSLAILAWLDRQFPAKPLFGETAQQAAEIWSCTTAYCDYLRASVDQLLAPVLVQGIDVPASGSQEMTTLQAAGELMHTECAALNSAVSGSPFICGSVPSAADAVAYPEIRLLQRAIDQKPDVMNAASFRSLDSQYPELSKWVGRVGAISGMDETLPVHW